MIKFGSVIDRINMKLGSNFLSYLRTSQELNQSQPQSRPSSLKGSSV